MNSHSKTSTFSAPVVQSRLEHHHQQQLKQPEGRHLPHHQRSKSLNKGKRGSSFNNYHQKTKETTNFTTSPSTISSTEFPRKNFSNYSNNFDTSYLKNNDFGLNNNNLVENASVGQLQRKISAPSRPQRRHQHSDSVDEDKFRVTPPISILKRPQSATDFVKSTSNSKSSFSLDVTQKEQGFAFQNHRSNKVGERSPPPQQRRSQSKERRRSDVTPSRTKHAQRKEVKSMEFETNLTFGVNSGSGDESDVNSNNKYVKSVSSLQSSTAVMFPPLNYDNAIIALEEGMNSNRKDMLYFNSDDNATIKSSSLKKRSEQYIESTPRRRSSTAIELQSHLSRFADSDSIPLSSESLLSSTPPSARRPSSSPSRLGGGPKLYAGPTFHNSPAPSDLPMPSFYGKSFGKEPSPLSAGNNLFTVPENTPSYDAYSSPSSGNTSDDDMFSMDDLEPPKAPYYSETPTLRKQKSQELLRILATANTRQNQTASAYMVPERMATAHHPMQVYPANGLNLNEISETLRSLLKIHGQ